MRRSQLVLIFAFLALIVSLPIGWQEQSAAATNAETVAESPAGASQTLKPVAIMTESKPAPDAKNLSPRISFEKTVCDLSDVGQGTKNTCEFRFTNTGRGLLKIGKISRTCGWRR